MNLLQQMLGLNAGSTFSNTNGQQYLAPFGVMDGSKQVKIQTNFGAMVSEVYNQHGIVGACVTARALLVSQMVFKYRNLSDGPQAALFGDKSLLPLEHPSPNLTRSRLLYQAEQHVSLAGAAYFYLNPVDNTVRLLNPSWVTIQLASTADSVESVSSANSSIAYYLYSPGGDRNAAEKIAPEHIAQWCPEPHPSIPFIGQSWVMTVLSEIGLDRQASDHLAKFYENAATPQLVFTMDKSKTPTQIKEYAKEANDANAGVGNAYKNLYIGGGADVKVVGSMLAQLNYEKTQGAHETRIVARSRVPAAILGISSGLEGSALNAGNYSSARRMWADGWFSPHADSLCASLENIVKRGPGTELTWDPSRVLFMQEDRKDEAEIRAHDAQTMRTLVDAGYDAKTVVESIRSGDWSKLKHTGLFSVQLQPPGAATSQGEPKVPMQGKDTP